MRPLEPDDLFDLIPTLPPALAAALPTASTGRRHQQQLKSMLNCPEDAAAGLMNTDVIEVRAEVKVGAVLRSLRQRHTLPPQTDMLMVVDRQGAYRGALVTSGLDVRVSELMRTDLAGIPVDTPGGVLGVAILIKLPCAAVARLAIPIIHDRRGIDPALAGSVILTALTDVIGFFTFPELASWRLL